jgi:sec-independent protein translocase protein TatB
MFEVGFTEIALIFAIALLVLGPARLPKLAADLGRWAGRARAMARQLRAQLEQEAQYDPLRESPSEGRTIHSPTPTDAGDTAQRPGRPDESRDS